MQCSWKMTTALDFENTKGVLTCNGTQYYIKGTNWFGFESNISVVHGLWQVSMASILSFCTSNGFNALRIPFSCQFALNLGTTLPNNPDGSPAISYSANPSLQGLSSAQVLDQLVLECAKLGILIMLDMHTLLAGGPITELWYDSITTQAQVLQGWTNMVDRYKGSWNVFAIDLKNEPHGSVSWGDGNAATDIAMWYKQTANAMLAINPNLLVFVEGIDHYTNPSTGATDSGCWGSNLQWVARTPIVLSNSGGPRNAKLVYSAHEYGAGVTGTNSTSAEWQQRFGFIHGTSSIVTIGEWGGNTVDYAWQQGFASWLAQKGINNNFYWCINPDSRDTGGLLQSDWVTPVTEKLAFCTTANPSPSVISVSADGSTPSFPPMGPVNPPVPPPPTSTPVSVTIIPSTSWTSNGQTIYEISVTLTNNGTQVIRDITLSMPVGTVTYNIWNAVVSGTTVTMPTWFVQNGLASGASYGFGGQFVSQTPTFAVTGITYA